MMPPVALPASERDVEGEHQATYCRWCELATTSGMQAFGGAYTSVVPLFQ